MPTYQYACTECGHQLEAVQSFSDAALTECPNCAGKLRKVFNSVGIVFKGSGFYRNDSRAGEVSAEKPDKADKPEKSDKSEKSEKPGKAEKSDSPTANKPASSSSSSDSSSSSSAPSGSGSSSSSSSSGSSSSSSTKAAATS